MLLFCKKIKHFFDVCLHHFESVFYNLGIVSSFLFCDIGTAGTTGFFIKLFIGLFIFWLFDVNVGIFIIVLDLVFSVCLSLFGIIFGIFTSWFLSFFVSLKSSAVKVGGVMIFLISFLLSFLIGSNKSSLSSSTSSFFIASSFFLFISFS